MNKILIIFVLGFYVSVAQAQNSGASWICDSIFKSRNVGCDQMAAANNPGGSFPLLKDAFNLNPSSLPTVKTPVGVEMFWDKSKTNVSFIKGTGKTGHGIATSTAKGPFFSNVSNVEVAQLEKQFERRSYDTEYSGAQAPNVNFGNAMNLFGSGKPISSNIGLNFKYLSEAHALRPGLGWNFKIKFVNGGVSVYKSPNVGNVINASVGMKIMSLLGDLTYIENTQGDANRTLIASGTFVYRQVSLTAAYRQQKASYLTDAEITQLRNSGLDYKSHHSMWGINWRPTDKLSFGFYNNYILNKGTSFVAQYFF